MFSAGGLEGEEAAVSPAALDASANLSSQPASAPAAVGPDVRLQAGPLLDDRPSNHSELSVPEPKSMLPSMAVSTDGAAQALQGGELAVSPAELLSEIEDMEEADIPEAAIICLEGPPAEQDSLALQDTLYENVLIALLEGLR